MSAIDPPLTAALATTAAAYAVAAWRAARWPRRRTGAFLAGVALLWIALQSGLHARAEELLSAHMVQHMLLTIAAAPLLVLGAPLTLALRSARPGPRQALACRLRSRPVRALASPVVAVAAFGAVLVGTHLPAFYEAALRHAWLHDGEHLLYIGSALALWSAVLEAEPPLPRRSPIVRILVLLAAMPAMTFVGVALLSLDRLAYAEYAAPAARLGIEALADQRTAGEIMWLGGTIPLAVLVVVLGWSALLGEERRARVRDAYAERRGAAHAGTGGAPPPPATGGRPR